MLHKIVFYASLAATIGLLTAGFILPPTGQIDPSVLTAGGILFAFATLGQVPYAIEKGRTATLTHGNTTITVSRKKKKDEQPEEQ